MGYQARHDERHDLVTVTIAVDMATFDHVNMDYWFYGQTTIRADADWKLPAGCAGSLTFYQCHALTGGARKLSVWPCGYRSSIDDSFVYDEGANAFHNTCDPGLTETLPGTDIDGRHLYPIGAGSWTRAIVDKSDEDLTTGAPADAATITDNHAPA